MSRWEGFEELVAVVDAGGFSAAARVLGVSKGHVSQQVSRLEDRLNARLLNRTTRKVSLTETGALYYAQCRQVVEDLEAVERQVTELQQEAKGLLKISAPHLIGEVLLVPAIAEFLKHNPQIEIDLELASHKVDLIEQRFDLAVEVGQRREGNLINRSLAPTQFRVVASPEYLARNPAPRTPQDLPEHRCLLFVEGGYSKPWTFTGAEGTLSIPLSSRWRSNSGHALRSAALQGLGLAYLPDYYLGEQLSSGSLVTVLEDWNAVEREIVAVYAHRRHLSAKLRLFTDFLAASFSQQIARWQNG